MRYLTLAILLLSITAHGSVYNSDGSESNVASLVSSAVDGDTVTLPAGTFTWTGGVVTTAGKGVTIQGAGSGAVLGRSLSNVEIGTGTKVFTATYAGLDISNGQTLTIERTGNQVSGGSATATRGWMQGTVTSYTGTTLTMDITSTNGSGTHPVWYIRSEPTTRINFTSTSAVNVISATSDATHSTTIEGIFFGRTVASAAATATMVNVSGSGKPVIVKDCYFERTNGNYSTFYSSQNKGLVFNCSFTSHPFSQAGVAIHHVCDGITDSWDTPHTMGNADTTGESNLYIEDCVFAGWLNATDFDGNARAVMRYSTFDNSAIGTHGADTSFWGVRHWEAYGNEFIHDGFSNGQTLPMTWFFYVRGGTFVIHNNIIDAWSGSDYSASEINMTVMNLRRNAAGHGCWGADDPGNQYPAPRQVGMGNITGAAASDAFTYLGDSDPAYYWDNTEGGTINFGISNYSPNECTNADSAVDYIVENRDYFVGTARPGYTPYTYPHPLRGEAASARSPRTPAAARRSALLSR